MNTRQIPGRDKIGSLAPGKYKTFKGTEISIKNCVKAKVKDLRVEGKTYQNLFKAELSQGHVGNSSTTYDLRVNSEGFSLEEKTYTLYINTNYQLLLYYDYVNTGSSYVSWTDKIVWTNSTKTNNIRIMVKKTDNSEITVDEVIGKIVLLEGDYTNIDIPNSINGIESVAEREKNLLSIKINDNTTTLNLPIPLRSLPNNVCDTIEGNTLVQRVGKVVLDGSLDEEWEISNKINNLLNVGFLIESCVNKPRNPNIAYYYFCDKLPNQDTPIADTKTEGIMLHGKKAYIRIFLDKLDSKDIGGFRTWLSENPVTIYYELAEPIIHDLEIPQLNTSKGANIITTENNIKPNMTMKVKVKK
ncbi:MAG: hypothetical protein ACLUF8_05180 [Clostridium sp.]